MSNFSVLFVLLASLTCFSTFGEDIDFISVPGLCNEKIRAPTALKSQWLEGQIKYHLHHAKPIHDGGGVYDLDNLS